VCSRIDRPAKAALSGPGPFEYSVTFAFCSPRDNFSRPVAHEQTAKRAASQTQSIRIKSKTPLAMRAVALRAFSLALTGKNPNIKVPSWLESACLGNLQPYSRSRR